MNYDVQLTETFQKSIKALKKKYPHVKDDLLPNVKALEEDLSAGGSHTRLEQRDMESQGRQL